MSNKKYKCPYCEEKLEKEELINHIDKTHQDLIPEKYSGARLVFNIINKKDHGKCIVCGKETDWNEKTYKYNRLCSNPKCRESLRKSYEKNMLKVYNKVTLLNDPDQQEKMLSNRKISGKYKFKDGGIHIYTGSYEKKALEFMDKVMNIPSTDIMAPGPKFKYEYNGKSHVWITDIYYIPYNLVIEIKDGGDNPNNREMVSYREKQVAKEKMITNKGTFNYIRLTNNNFLQLMYILAELKMKMIDNDKSKSIKINEYCAAVGGAIPSLYSDGSYVVTSGQKNTFTDDYGNYSAKYISSNNKVKDADNLKEVIDNDSIGEKIKKYNIYRVKDESVFNKEILSNDQFDYDNMLEEVNIKKLNSRASIAEATTIQEFNIAMGKKLLYLPLMNPVDIKRKNLILKENDEFDILEDIDGYFLYNKKTGARDKSYKDMEDISLDDTDLVEDDLEIWSVIGNKTILKNDYDDENELENDWLNYNSMYKKLRRESDWKALETFGKTNPERYNELKYKFMKQDIKDPVSTAEYDGKNVSYNAGIKEEADISSNSDNIEISDKSSENIPSDNIQNIPDLKYTNREIDLAIDWSIKAMRHIILPVKTLEELEEKWINFKSMIRKNQRESDWKSLELFGVNNETHYNYLKMKLSKADIPTSEIPKDDNTVASSDVNVDKKPPLIQASMSTAENIASDLQSNDVTKVSEAYESLENIDRNKLSTYEDAIIQNISMSSLPDFFADIPKSDLIDLPYFSPFELDDIGIFVGENNRYSSNPDNTTLEFGNPKSWFEKYRTYFSTCGMSGDEEYNKINIARIHKLQELYLTYPDILKEGNINKINSRKQSILELGWNPEIDFDENTRYKVDKRVNNIINESLNNISFIDISESVNKSPDMVNADDEVHLNDLIYRPVYIVFLRCDNLFGKLVRLFKRGYVTHTSIGFNPSLKSLYSFNGLHDGFNLESITRYQNVKNMKVFVIFVPSDRYHALRNNVNYFVRNRSKTFYNYLGVITLGIKNKAVDNAGKLTMFCSQFVDRMLKLSNMDFTKKDSSLVTPYNLYLRLRRQKNYVYKLYDGPMEKYNENRVRGFLSRYLERLITKHEFFSNILGYNYAISEAKDFPIQFDNDGNLLISKKFNVDFDKEYNDSHKLLMIYDKSKNYDGMKYELSKLWYLNSLIERKLFSKNGKDKNLYKSRARILNDFNKYLETITKEDSKFNFTKYYENTPFNDATVRIHGSTLKYGIEFIKRLIKP